MSIAIDQLAWRNGGESWRNRNAESGEMKINGVANHQNIATTK